jgi:hypothetical protein
MKTLHLLILSLSIGAATTAHAAAVFTDTFDSGTGSWYVASTGATGASLDNDGTGRLRFIEGSNGVNMQETIGRSFTTQSLSVGETIRLTFDFAWDTGATTTGAAQIIRAGLFDVTNPISAANWSGSNAIGAGTGYYTFIRDGNASGNIARLESWTTASSTVGPTNGGGTVTALGSNTTNFNINDNATITYQALFEVTYVSATQVDTLFTLTEGATTRFSVAGSQTSGSLVTSFDSVVIKTGAANPTSYIDNVKVEVIPEPGSVALLGLGGLALLRRRR